MIKNRLVVMGIALGLLLLTGCAQTPSNAAATIPLPTPDVLSASDRERLAAEDQANTRDRLLGEFPSATVPRVQRERFIDLAESMGVLAQCMTTEGFPSVAAHDGGNMTSETTLNRSEASSIALYTCSSRFPVDPKYLAPPNKSQITYLYNYQTKVLKPCLEAAGYKVDEPPTLQAFLARYLSDGGGWSAYSNVAAGSLWASINRQCPQIPEHLHG